MKLSTYYQRDRYNGSKRRDRIPMFQKRFAFLSQHIQFRQFHKVLDAGCGDGGLAVLIQKEIGSVVFGVDISKRGINLAKKQGVAARIGDISEKIPYPKGYFDAIVASEIIEHLVNPDGFLRQCHRVLRPGGKLILTTPNVSFWLNRIIFPFGIYPVFLEASTEFKVGLGMLQKFLYDTQPVGHIHVFNAPALGDLLCAHGFSINRIIGNPVEFVSPSSSVATGLYRLADSIFSRFPSLASNVLCIAQKQG